MIFDDCHGPGHVLADPGFLAECRAYNERLSAAFRACFPDLSGILILTLDCEVFPRGTRAERANFPRVMADMAKALASRSMAATFCVQLEDSMPVSRRTPADGVRGVIEALGPEAIGLHCVDHVTHDRSGRPRTYDAAYLDDAASRIETEFGVAADYFAQPSWVMTQESAVGLSRSTRIRAARGVQSGPSFWRAAPSWNLRFPYLYMARLYHPYQYVDWNFLDIFGRELSVDVLGDHARAVAESVREPFFMESIGHPFRLTRGDGNRTVQIFAQSLDIYAERGVRIVGASEAASMFEELSRGVHVPDWADLLPDLVIRGDDLARESAGKLPADLSARNLSVELTGVATGLRRRQVGRARRRARRLLPGRSTAGSA